MKGIRIVLVLVLLGAAGLVSGQSARPVGDTALLPPNGFLDTWKRPDQPRVYSRADLYGYIDGGAELFFEFGFEELTQQKYQAGAGQVVIDFYRMTDPVAATGIYLMKCGKESRVQGLSERHTINRYQLMWVRDRYFVIMTNVAGAASIEADLLKAVSFVASKLPASQPSSLINQLPPDGLVKDSVRLVRGPYALQSIFTLGDGDILQLGGRVTAVAGNYADQTRGTWTQLEVTYPTPVAASAAMSNLQAHLDSYLTPLSKSPTRLTFRDYEEKFGLVTVRGASLSAKVRLAQLPQ